MSCILSQLKILCTIESYHTENDDSFVIHRSHVTATLRFLQYVLDFIEAEWSIYQNVQQLNRSNFEFYRY